MRSVLPRSVASSSLLRLGKDIRRTVKHYRNENNAYRRKVASLRPAGKPKGNVLLSRMHYPFFLKRGGTLPTIHQNFWEIRQMAKIFLNLGYSVDVVHYLNKAFVPEKDYSLLIDVKWNPGTIGPLLNKGCIRTPLFCFFLYPLGSLIEKRRSFQLAFVFLAVLSFGMHAVGAYWYDATWDAQESVWKDPGRLWSWSGSPFVYYGRYPYWDLGQVTEWIGLRDDIHVFFQHLRGRYHRSPEASRAHLQYPGHITIRTSSRAAYPAIRIQPYTRDWGPASPTTRPRI